MPMTIDPPWGVFCSRAWRRAWTAGLGAFLAACAPVTAPNASDPQAQTPLQRDVQATMQRGVVALATLLPIALEPGQWERAGHAREIRDSVAALREASVQLDGHPHEPDVPFAFLNRSLRLEARALERDIEGRRYSLASERVVRMAETCVACHARLPGADREEFARALTAWVDLASLSPVSRATFQAATRQFDAALETYEGQFADPSTPVAALELSGAVPSYLILALRVRRDPERAERGLAMLAARSDLSARLQGDVETWRGAVVALAPDLRAQPSLAAARRILEEGRALNDFPWQGSGTIHEIVASSVLYRYIEESKPREKDLAEALYLLARSEAFLFRSFERFESQQYLERAIRIAPHTDVASRAYSVLELEVALRYGPSGVPQDGREWLERLRELSTVRSMQPTEAPLGVP